MLFCGIIYTGCSYVDNPIYLVHKSTAETNLVVSCYKCLIAVNLCQLATCKFTPPNYYGEISIQLLYMILYFVYLCRNFVTVWVLM